MSDRFFWYPSLTPTYGLGSGCRIRSAILISGPRTRIGSQGRIYAWMKNHGKGYEYKEFLLRVLGPNPKVSPWAGF